MDSRRATSRSTRTPSCSWRAWQSGLRVRYVPDALGLHRYEFSRVPQKLYLAERNRLLLVLTCWETRTLAVLAPAFVAVEVAVAAAALRGGWFRQKLDGWKWILLHARWVRARRRHLQAGRDVPDRELAWLWTAHLDARNFPIPPALRPLDQLLAGYWALARRALRAA